MPTLLLRLAFAIMRFIFGYLTEPYKVIFLLIDHLLCNLIL
jgi:hypothetical protein